MLHVKGRTVFVDVDDTILIWNHEDFPELEKINITDEYHNRTFAVHKKHVEFIKNLDLIGFKIIVWSASGDEWANLIVDKLKLTPHIDYCMSKPEFVMDDLKDPMEILTRILYFDPATGKKRD